MTARRPRPAAERVFDVADRDLAVGDLFRWPCGDGSRRWRITDVVDPDVDELTQRVRAVPVSSAHGPCCEEFDRRSACTGPAGEHCPCWAAPGASCCWCGFPSGLQAGAS